MEEKGRKILNEVLNSDYKDLAERLEDTLDGSINLLGTCGESPAHIAIYKNDKRMLKMLLDAGSEPNFMNLHGDTLMHVAALLGSIEFVTLLYETGKCDLNIRNKDNLTALDIANKKISLADFYVTKLFSTYRSDVPLETDDIEVVKRKRKECSIYLSKMMAFDGIAKVESVLKHTLDNNINRNRARTIMRGQSSTNQNHTQFTARMVYPADRKIFSKDDESFVDNYFVGLDYIVRTVFVCSFVNRSMTIGLNNIMFMHNRAQAKTHK